MSTAEQTLTDEEQRELEDIARRTGRTPGEIAREAVRQFLVRSQPATRRSVMQQARGMWQGRADLPDWSQLRQEFDRHG